MSIFVKMECGDSEPIERNRNPLFYPVKLREQARIPETCGLLLMHSIALAEVPYS